MDFGKQRHFGSKVSNLIRKMSEVSQRKKNKTAREINITKLQYFCFIKICISLMSSLFVDFLNPRKMLYEFYFYQLLLSS